MGEIKALNTKLKQLFAEFFDSEHASGMVLIFCTALSLAISNSPMGKGYLDFWHLELFNSSLQHWINDGLMTVFFLLIGLEIEREIYVGELSSIKNASLPIFAAVGGMLTPALLHFLFNHGTPTQSGAGIPTATDIAFALGVLALFGNKIPLSLKIFLTALAIIDDLGAIVIIAVFYANGVAVWYLGLALAIFAGLLVLNRKGVLSIPLYVLPGIAMWYLMLRSGVHPTIVGVLLAFAIPFGRGDGDFPSYRLQHLLHKPVAYVVMPLFAMANTGIVLREDFLTGLLTPNSLGIMAGLLIGKPLGIALFSLLAVKFGVSQLPRAVTWKHIVGAGFLGGIGFTMSIFITLLAFDDPDTIQLAKVTILLASLTAGTIGYLTLLWQTRSMADGVGD